MVYVQFVRSDLLYPSFLQVVENVRVFITDANDEKPEFLNLPFIVDVPEVRMEKNRQCHRKLPVLLLKR